MLKRPWTGPSAIDAGSIVNLGTGSFMPGEGCAATVISTGAPVRTGGSEVAADVSAFRPPGVTAKTAVAASAAAAVSTPPAVRRSGRFREAGRRT